MAKDSGVPENQKQEKMQTNKADTLTGWAKTLQSLVVCGIMGFPVREPNVIFYAYVTEPYMNSQSQFPMQNT